MALVARCALEAGIGVGDFAHNAVDVSELLLIQGGIGIYGQPGVDARQKGRVFPVQLESKIQGPRFGYGIGYTEMFHFIDKPVQGLKPKGRPPGCPAVKTSELIFLLSSAAVPSRGRAGVCFALAGPASRRAANILRPHSIARSLAEEQPLVTSWRDR